MTPGALVRSLLGDALFRRVVAVYRAIYVDLRAVAACIPALPPNAELLDVGGGDGALLEHLLEQQPDLRASIVDLRESVGLSLTGERRARVRLFPATRLRDCASRGVPRPDAVVIADVLHHVPRDEREPFLRELAEFIGPVPRFLAIKEVAHDGWRATLGLVSDRYVTGDRHVALLAREEVLALVARTFPALEPRETPLYERDAPNYCIVFEPRDATGRASSSGPSPD